ncbi:epimerase [Altererythrobacter sp. B11]|uniref:SDR family NAD(P)-dependent oxidoreductase n=1 Tax=Altererythrobacter sp. B11 TaxID=2060312 RepID=UPI000DC72561|nr:SDR family NAD(P)-dependent oxidoreductase [Altererythrobacter sp. B11]BBC71361.1 epimerase [Altererythrobacter sp. B11]
MAHLFIFGLGYTASYIKAAAEGHGWLVSATGSAGNVAFEDDAAVRAHLARASHVLSSVPPSGGDDPVLARYGAELPRNRWIGYLSSTGVYGDTGGAWVDETAPTGTGRRALRAACDAQWLAHGAHVFRLPGIYGPGRSVIERLRAGTAHRVDMPGQVFSRVHVADIVSGVIAGFAGPPGAYNLADDCPASQNEVMDYAARLLGIEPPPILPADSPALSPAARAFYSENRRIANGRARRLLGWRPRYRDYRIGLMALARG